MGDCRGQLEGFRDVQHATPLISMLALGLGLAFVFGALAARLRLSPLVGYLIAGVVVGPFTPGYVADAELASELSEVGVILLMFGVGLHFSAKDLLSVRAVAVPATLIQIAVMTLAGLGVGLAFGWPPSAGIVFGLALSVASTVVSLRNVQDQRLMQTDRGKLIVGWLVVEDLLMIVVLVLLPTWAHIRGEVSDGGTVSVLQLQDIGWALLLTLLKVTAFALLMFLGGKRFVPWVLHLVAHTGSKELFRLAVLALALGVAYAAASFFDISLALGALFAGLIMGESELSQQAANETLPLRDAFAVLFFVSVGMLVDPLILIENPWPLLATALLIVVFRTALGVGILRLLGQPLGPSLEVSGARSQIAEFSFIVAGMGVSLGLMPEEVRDLVLGGAMVSILLTPLTIGVMQRWVPKAPAAPPAPPPRPARAVLVGHGRVGSLISRALADLNTDFAVIEEDVGLAEQLRGKGWTAFSGNATSPDLLREAGVESADLLIVTVPNGFEAGRIVEAAREMNPDLKVYARAHSDAEVEHLRGFGADLIISGEFEIAQAMIKAARQAIPRRTLAAE